MAQPIRFEQDPEGPEGAGDFEFDTGQRLYAYDPEIAGRLSAASARLAEQPDLRTAANDVASGGTGGTGGGPSRSDAGPSTATSGQQAFTPAGTDQAPPPPAVTSPVPPEALAAAAEEAKRGNGMQPVNLGAPPQQAPSAGAEVPMVYQQARQGGFVPTAQTTTTEGQGAPYSQEDLEARELMNQGVVKAQLANFDAQRAAAEEQAARSRAMLPQLEFQRAQAQSELAAKEQAYKIERAKAQTYVDAAAQRKVDPKSIYHDAGTAGSIALIIGQALGAFGAALTHTDNYAARMVSEAQERAIAAQMDEIQRGQVSADNMLARVGEELGGDYEQAKSVLKMASLSLLDEQIKEQAAATQSGEVQRAANLWLAQNQQARLAEEQKFRDQSIGKTSTSTSTKYQAPQSGGMVPMSLEQQVKRKELLARGAKADATVRAGGVDPDKGPAADAKEFGKRRADFVTAAQANEDLIGALGLEVRPNGSVGFKGGEKKDLPGVGYFGSMVPDKLTSDEGIRIRQALKRAIAQNLKAQSGAAVSEPELERKMQEVLGDGTERSLLNGVQQMFRDTDALQRNLEGSFSPDTRKTYGANQREAQRDRYAAESDESDVERY